MRDSKGLPEHELFFNGRVARYRYIEAGLIMPSPHTDVDFLTRMNLIAKGVLMPAGSYCSDEMEAHLDSKDLDL